MTNNGEDSYFTDGQGDEIHAGGDDGVYGDDGDDTLYGDDGADELHVGAGAGEEIQG